VRSAEKDTTDRHRLEETPEGQENYLKTVFNSVQIGLLIIDPETHLIFDVNPKVAELIGLERSKIIGSVCNLFICPAEAGKCPITDLGQNIDNSERILLKADGSRLPILKTVIHITIEGHDYLLESFLDINDRKIIEGELQESEAKFKDLAERALVGIYLIQDGIFKYVNPKFAEIHGYSVDEMLGVMGPKDVIYSDDCPVADENIRKRLCGESQSIRYETRIVTKNGDIRSVELYGSRTLFQSRPGVVGTALDTTERKLVEEELTSEKERLESVTQSIGAGMAVISRDYRTVWANKVLTDIFGECVGKVCYAHYNQQEEICSGCGAREIFEGGREKMVHEQMGSDSAGNTIWSQIIATPIRDRGGNITSALELVVPITERKQAEEAIGESHNRLTDILDGLDSLVYVADFNSYELLFLNKYGRKIWGEVQGRKCWQVFQKGQKGPCSFCTNDKLVSDAGISTGVCQWEFQNTVNGRWYECRDQAIPWTGKKLVRMEIATDITARKRAEEDLLEAKLAADESQAQYEQVVSMISDIVWRYDVDLQGQFVASYISPVADRMLGLPDGTIGNSFDKFFSYVHPDDLPAVQKVLYEAISVLAKKYATDFRLRTADGTTIWVRARGSVYSQPDGKITAFGTTSDITESKRAEEALRLGEEKYRTLYNNMQEAVALHELVCDEIGQAVEYRIVDVNPMFESIIDTTRDTIINKISTEAYGTSLPPYLSEYSAVVHSGIPIHFETFFPPLNKYFEISASPWGQNGFATIFSDITERKRAEEALREANLAIEASRAQYEQVVSRISDIVWSYNVNAKGELIGSYISPVADRMLGLPFGTIRNNFDKYLSYVHPDDLPAVQDSLSNLIKTLGIDLTNECRMLKADGTTIWVRAKSSASSLPDGGITAVGISSDITESKNAELELQESKQRLSNIIDFLPDATFAIDKAGTVIAWNRAIEEMTGIGRNDMIGQSDYAYAVPFYGLRKPMLMNLLDKNEDEIASNYQYVQKGGNALYAETFTSTLRQGKGAHVWITAGPIFDALGNRIGAIESIRDITERKYEQDELKNNLRFLETLIETIPSPIFFTDRQGRYLGCNDAFARQILGVSKENIIGKSVFELPESIPSDLADLYYEQDQKLFRKPGAQAYEMQVQSFTGDTRDFLFTKATFKNHMGDVAGIVGVMLDVTTRKQAELSLESSIIRQKRLNGLMQDLLASAKLEQKLKKITDGVVEVFGADFCRIWITRPGDLCEDGCKHALVTEGPHVCRYRDRCLHLLASSGRYTHIDGEGHRRVPFGCYKIGLVASGVENKFLTNDVQNDPRVHDHEWAKEAGLESFAGYQLRPPDGDAVGVLALFSKQKISSEDDAQLEALSNMTALIIQADRIDEELRASNRIIEGIINAIPVMVFWKNKDLVYIGCNEIFARDAGYADPKDVVGKDDYQMVWRDQAELYRADDLQVIESGRSKLFIEEPQTTPDGKVIVLLTSKIPLKSSKGEVVGVLGIYMDITERSKMETALRDSKEYLDKIINSIGDPIFVVDRQHRHTLVNDAMCELSNRTREDFIGKTPYDFFPKEQVDVFVQKDEVVFETGKESANEETITDARGAIRTVITKKTLYTDASGNKSIVGIIMDITDRKKAEEKLKSAHDQLLAIIDFLPDATFVIDKDGVVIAWNRAIEVMTGIQAKEIMGKGDYEYAIPFYGERRPVLIDLLLRQVKEIEDKYVRIERKDEALEGEAYMPNMNAGSVYLYGKAAALYDSTGNLYGAIESIRDVTERRNAEQVRERLVKELESKNAEMERFTYTVSHDLRSPLITVSGLVGFLKSDLDKGNITRTTTFLERITNAIAKMDNLLKDTLELSRIGRVANPPEKVAFDDIVQDALSQVQERITKSGTKITVAEAMPDVFVDKMRIAEVMVNLIENGIKYMGDQAHPEIEIGHRIKDGQYTFFVKDNGMGIDPSQFDKVFELFYKVNAKSEGTGAGLAIVKRIIEVQGGRIWVESENGMGSTFCFNLPQQPSKGV